MLKLRACRVTCPCCRHLIDIDPPDSLPAERIGLTHRCPWCRRLLATTISPGPVRILDVLIIGPSDRAFGLELVSIPPASRQSASC